MNIITIELCAEDRARLDRLTAALEAARTPVVIEENLVELEDYAALETAPETPQNDDEAEGGEITLPEPEEPKSDEKPASPAVTVEDLRSKYMELSATPKRDQARAIIKAYSEKISEIAEDKRAEVLAKLNELGAKR